MGSFIKYLPRLLLLYISFFTIAFATISIKASPTEAALIQCSLNSVIVNGNELPPTSTIPQNNPFSVKLSCSSFPDGNPHSVTVTVGGNSVTRNDLIGVVSTTFGPLPGLAGGDTPQTYKPYTVAVQVSGFSQSDVTCNCEVRILNNTPADQPQPTPLPAPNCEVRFKQYNPNPPLPNQILQIQWYPHPNNKIDNYKVKWTIPGTNQKDTIPLEDNTATFGVWVANLPAFNREFKWELHYVLGSDMKCDERTVFAGIGGSSSKNPCVGGECKTALGNIPTNPQAFASKFLSIAIGLAGGLAFILMVIGAIRVLTSSGDQQRLSGGRDMIVAAIAGLLFIIFSVLILQFIGIEIIGLSG